MTDSPNTMSPSDRAHDPLMDVAREIGRLDRRNADLDNEQVNAKGSAAVYIDSEIRHVGDRIDALIDYASTLKAQSLEGAMFQLALLNDCLNSLTDSQHSPGEAAAIGRRGRRFGCSIQRVLSNMTGIDPAERYLDRFMGGNRDPWDDYETRLAKCDQAQRRDQEAA